jgi:hypothetical protein
LIEAATAGDPKAAVGQVSLSFVRQHGESIMQRLAILVTAALFVVGVPFWLAMPKLDPPALAAGKPGDADLDKKVAELVDQDEERLDATTAPSQTSTHFARFLTIVIPLPIVNSVVVT